MASSSSLLRRLPFDNICEDGYLGTYPVGRFPANGHALVDMIDTVSEWTDHWYQDQAAPVARSKTLGAAVGRPASTSQRRESPSRSG